MAKNTLLEIACFNFESALVAEQNGADRIELCENYSEGGITPNLQLIQKVKLQIEIPIHVMIRPRGRNFIYNSLEFEEMKRSIQQCKDSAVEGIVFGILDGNNLVDKKRCREIVEFAKPMTSTFHRAYDEACNSKSAMMDIIECGFERILTSGQKLTALEGAELISGLMKYADNRIIIIPGGGVRAENISELKRKTGAKEFHSAAIKTKAVLPDANEISEMNKRISQ